MKIRTILATLVVCLAFPPHSIWGQEESQSLGDLARKIRERKLAQPAPSKELTNDDMTPARPGPAPASGAGKVVPKTPVTLTHGGALTDCGTNLPCFLKAFDDGKPAMVRQLQKAGKSGINVTQRSYLEVSNFTADHSVFYTKVEDRSAEFTAEFDRMARQAGMSDQEIGEAKKGVAAKVRPKQVEELACLFSRKTLRSLLQNWSANRYSTEDFNGAEKCEGYPMPTSSAGAQAPATPRSSPGEMYVANPAASEQQLRQALKERPADIDSHYMLGRILAMQSRMDEALAELRKVVELNPRHPLAWMDIGTIYQTRHDLAKAAESYNKAIEAAPGDDRPYINLCSIYLEQERNDKTAEFCEAAAAEQIALQLRPGDRSFQEALAKYQRAM